MSAENISIKIVNNTNGNIDISVMGNPADLTDNANATTEYRYDVTSLVFTNENTVNIEYKVNGASSFTNYTTPLLQPNLDGVLAALNILGLGSWFSFTSGGNTYISNYDDQYTFGNLNIFGNTTLGVSYFIDTQGYPVGGSIGIDVNAINVVLATTPAIAAADLPSPLAGDVVDFYGTSPTSSGDFTAYVKNVNNGTFLYNQVVPSATFFTFTFTLAASTTYEIFFATTP